MPLKPKSYAQLLAAAQPDARGRQPGDREYALRRKQDPPQVAAERVRSSARWKRVRAWKMKVSPLCETCLAAGVTTAAVDVDHVVPVVYLLRAGTRERAFDMNVLASICRSCHNQKTARERLDRRQHATHAATSINATDEARRGQGRALTATHRAFDEDTSGGRQAAERRGEEVISGAESARQRARGFVPLIAGFAPFSGCPLSPGSPASTPPPGQSAGGFGHARSQP